MKRVLTAVILIPLVVLALFRAPLWLFTLLVLGVALLAAREYFDIAEKTGFRPFRALAYAALALSFGISYLVAFVVAQLSSIARQQNESIGVDLHAVGMGSDLWALSVVIVLVFAGLIFLSAGLRCEALSNALPDAAVSYLLIPYVAFTLGLIPILRSGENGALFLLYLMLLVWCGDIAAYYVGRAIGSHTLAPRISPGKTWEGAAASVIGAVIVGLLLFRFINPVTELFRSAHLLRARIYSFSQPSPQTQPFELAPVWFVIAFAVSVNVAAQLGDLVESALKRGAGVKDSGTLLPGHGGVLDRIDALLFALPVGLIFYIAGMS
ncbi:MAG: phosphatidate cytidylyltransferase, partial [Candidatus Korobacteraceae bacterium]